MRLLLFLPYYIRWHYSTALKSLARIIQNVAKFLWHFFSVSLNVRTFFAPFQRLQEERRRGFDIEALLSTMLINFIMRLVGAIVRGVFIIVGLVSIVLVMVFGLSVFFVWLILPVASLFMLVVGITFLLKQP